MGHIGSKTRSLGQILEKPSVCCRGHLFSPVLTKLGHENVCVNDIPSHRTLELDYFGSTTRSIGQILKKLYVSSRGHIFSLIHMKLGQNVYLNNISDEVESGSSRIKK